jgi:cell division protein FtsI/penicillin-binding protein 2
VSPLQLRRLRLVAILLLLGFAVLFARLVHIQILQHRQLHRLAWT